MADEQSEVLGAIDALTKRVEALRDEVTVLAEKGKPRHRATPHRLTAEDIRNAVFITTRLVPGYHVPDVDDLLDRVEEELTLLTQERDEARAELAELRGA